MSLELPIACNRGWIGGGIVGGGGGGGGSDVGDAGAVGGDGDARVDVVPDLLTVDCPLIGAGFSQTKLFLHSDHLAWKSIIARKDTYRQSIAVRTLSWAIFSWLTNIDSSANREREELKRTKYLLSMTSERSTYR